MYSGLKEYKKMIFLKFFVFFLDMCPKIVFTIKDGSLLPLQKDVYILKRYYIFIHEVEI